jgi:prevent-host-death family protein
MNVYEAKTQFSKLLEQVAAGDEIVIARYGKPVARLVPLQRTAEPEALALVPDEVAGA